MIPTVNCPVCGRGYPPSIWFKLNPRLWRLGVKQDPARRFMVVGDVQDPAELPAGVFEMMRKHFLNALRAWISNKWLSIKEVLNVIEVGVVAGRRAVHIWAEGVVPPVYHEVSHGFAWGKLPSQVSTEVNHTFRFGRR